MIVESLIKGRARKYAAGDIITDKHGVNWRYTSPGNWKYLGKNGGGASVKPAEKQETAKTEPAKTKATEPAKASKPAETKALLTDNEKQVLKSYIGKAYKALNQRLCEGKGHTEMSRTLESAISKFPKFEGTVYRDVVSYEGVQAQMEMWQRNIGNVWQPSQFTPSSTDLNIAQKFSNYVMYEIEFKHGRNLKGYNTKEREVLFPPNSRFKIVSVRRGANNGLTRGC